MANSLLRRNASNCRQLPNTGVGGRRFIWQSKPACVTPCDTILTALSFLQVWKARKVGSLQTVAIKLISKRGKTERDVKTLRQEIDILKKLKHPNIIEMIDAFETSTDFCVVTEFAQGELFQILEDDKRLPEIVVRSIAYQLVAALQYLHQNRVIHRDMKPQNILISANGMVKLCDFGFARAMSSHTLVVTSIKGTPLYMAPELVQEQPYNHTADLWSLGVILFELYSGQPPFYTTSIYSLIKAIVHDQIKWPASMSAEFKSFLNGLLEKAPTKRLDWPALAEHPFIQGATIVVTPRKQQATVVDPPSTTQKSLTPAMKGPGKGLALKKIEPNTPAHPRATNHVPQFTAWSQHPMSSNDPLEKKSRQADRGVASDLFGAKEKLDLEEEAYNLAEQSEIPAEMCQHACKDSSSKRNSENTNELGLAGYRSSDLDDVQEPVFKDPPQFSPNKLDKESVDSIMRVLSRGERQAKDGEVSVCWADASLLQAVLQTLKPPKGHTLTGRWLKKPELLQSLQTVIAMLRMPCSDTNRDVIASVITSIILASQAAICSVEIIVLAVEALKTKGARSSGMQIQVVSFFCHLISHRGAWHISAWGALGLLEYVKDAVRASTMDDKALEILQTVLRKRVPGRLCRCIESVSNDANSPRASLTIINALNVLWILLVDEVGASLSEQWSTFPCASLFSDGALESYNAPGLHPHVSAIKRECAVALLNSTETLNAIGEVICEPRQPSDALHMCQLLERACRIAPQLGLTVVGAKVHIALVCMGSSKLNDAASLQSAIHSAAMLALSSIISSAAVYCQASAVSGLLTKVAPPEGLEALVTIIIQRIVEQGEDAGPPAAACGVLAAILNLAMLQGNIDQRASSRNTGSPITKQTGQILLSEIPDRVLTLLSSVLRSKPTQQMPRYSAAEGFPLLTGLLDGPAALAASVTRWNRLRAIQYKLLDAALECLDSLATKDDASVGKELSPAGLLSLVHIVFYSLQADPKLVARLLVHPCAISVLIRALSKQSIKCISSYWDAVLVPAGENTPLTGQVTATALVDAVIGALYAPFSNLPHVLSEKDVEAAEWMEVLLKYKECLVPVLVRHVSQDASSGLVACVSLLSRFIVADNQSMALFVRSSGINKETVDKILDNNAPVAVLTSALLLISHIARALPDRHMELGAAGVIRASPLLLRHKDAVVRARAANLLGNLCRHNDKLYPELARCAVLPALIHLCQDSDRSARKFACFAIGNAAFHSSMLYESLRPSVTPLVALVSDPEERTRANAAGALGNLVRNSGSLCTELIHGGALKSLLNLIRSPGPLQAGSAMQIALFSLGNLTAHDECAEVLLNLRVREFLALVPSSDAVAQKYATRVNQKLDLYESKRSIKTAG